MLLIADITFSADSIAVISVLLGTLWGSLVVMWKHDVSQRERHLADIREQRDELWRVVIAHGLSDRVPAHMSPPPPPGPGSGVYRRSFPSDPAN